MIVDIFNSQIAYYHAPKCGSRTIVAWTVLISEPNLINDHPDWFLPSRMKEYPEIRSRVRLFPGTKQEWRNEKVPRILTPFNFCIVRDPVSRFLSGYINRIVYRRRMDCYPDSVEKFIENFQYICEKYPDIENHFRPQYKFYGEDPLLFNSIFKMNEFNQIKEKLEQISGVDLPHIKLQQNGGIEKPLLTPKQEDWIRNTYNKDYEIYGKYM